MLFLALARLQNSKGTSIAELLFVVTAVGFLVVLLASIPNSIVLIGKSRHESLAREIAAKIVEDQRNISYINLTDGETAIADSRLSLLPSGSGKTLIEDCDPVINSTICPNSEQVKLVTVTITWKDNNKLQTARLETLIGEGGLNQ